MKNYVVLIACFFFVTIAYSQQQAIRITKSDSKKEIIIKENKRVKIRTQDGRKLKGRFSIEGNTIIIDDEALDIMEISSIKRNSLFINILTSSFLIYMGAASVTLGLFVAALADVSASYWFIIPGLASIGTGILTPNFRRQFKRDKDWNLDIVTLPQ